ncbi:MAG: hypothetical protein KDA85_18185, partial [Planctomycetaceae bacterium]|nr:hypothetical protein [Planctomycetaceae bacterium]
MCADPVENGPQTSSPQSFPSPTTSSPASAADGDSASAEVHDAVADDSSVAELPITEAVLKPRRAQPFFGRHPWVFAGAVSELRTPPGHSGAVHEVVRLITSDGRFVAWGLLNRNSRIQIRLYSWDES